MEKHFTKVVPVREVRAGMGRGWLRSDIAKERSEKSSALKMTGRMTS